MKSIFGLELWEGGRVINCATTENGHDVSRLKAHSFHGKSGISDIVATTRYVEYAALCAVDRSGKGFHRSFQRNLLSFYARHVYTRSRFIDSLNYARNYENGIASPTSKIWIHCTHFIYRYLRYVLKFPSTTFPLFIRSCRYLFVARFKRASLTLIIRN